MQRNLSVFRDEMDDSARRGLSRRHLLAGWSAALLSLAIHFMAALFAPRMSLPEALSPARTTESPPPPSLPLRVENVWADARAAADAIEQWASPLAVGVNPVPLDLGAEADRPPPPSRATDGPPAAATDRLAANGEPLAPPPPAAARPGWDARQEILAIERQRAARELPALPRRRIPGLPRVATAPDLTLPVDRLLAETTPPRPSSAGAAEAAPLALIAQGVAAGATERDGTGAATDVSFGESAAMAGGGWFVTDPRRIADLRAIERLLTVRTTVFDSPADPTHRYLRIEIERAGEALLPVAAKDMLFVQDCSASMTEQRMHFCREGLRRAIERLNPGDRFNVAGFSDRVRFCFTEWVPLNDANRHAADAFIETLRSEGSTDIYGSLREMLRLPREPGRPAIALLISDGVSTAGVLDSSDIVGRFTRDNDGSLSVFSLGTVRQADRYLLDLLSYCNRGDADILRSGRWGIPEDIVSRMNGLNRPVLADLAFRFTGQAPGMPDPEVYPVRTSNLYLDRALVMYARVPRDQTRMLFYARGRAGATPCDMIFDVPLDRQPAQRGTDLRQDWAMQKIYHLMGELARNPTRAALDALEDTSRLHGLRIPYRRRLP